MKAKHLISLVIVFISLLLFSSCSKEPKPILYKINLTVKDLPQTVPDVNQTKQTTFTYYDTENTQTTCTIKIVYHNRGNSVEYDGYVFNSTKGLHESYFFYTLKDNPTKSLYNVEFFSYESYGKKLKFDDSKNDLNKIVIKIK